MTRALSVLAAAALCAACAASRPTFAPNGTYRVAGEERARADADICLARADRYVKAHPEARLPTGYDAVAGVTGSAGDVEKTRERTRAEADRCLVEKGYEVLGWH